VVEHPGRGVVDQRQERRHQRGIGAPGVGRLGGGPQQIDVVEQAPRGRDVQRLVELRVGEIVVLEIGVEGIVDPATLPPGASRTPRGAV
jgi:hypothetical protein